MYYKGIVMEIKEDYAIVMDDYGSVNKIKKKKGLKIGEIIFYTEEDKLKEEVKPLKGRKFKNWYMPIVTAALILLMVTTGIFFNKTSPYAVVTLDINPSIEIEVDKDEKIISIKGLNSDGEKLDLEKLKGMNLNEGTKVIKEYIDGNTEIKNKDSMIVGFAFLEEDKDKTFEDHIQKTLKDNFNGMNIVYLAGTSTDNENASKKGISLGRYKVDEEINEDLLEDAIENMSVPELIELLKKEGNPVYLNEEINDELEDRLEDEKEDKEDKDEDEDDEDNNEDDDENEPHDEDGEEDDLNNN